MDIIVPVPKVEVEHFWEDVPEPANAFGRWPAGRQHNGLQINVGHATSRAYLMRRCRSKSCANPCRPECGSTEQVADCDMEG